jgi:hypothetical protein
MTESLPLPAQLSAAFVAFTIEADNEAERRIAHHTTSFGGTGSRRSVWLTSLAMWFNCLRGLEQGGGELTVANLERRARMGTNLDGMRRWGYITIDGVGRVPRGERRPIGKPGSMLALTRCGRTAAEMWRPLPGEIEQRWRERFTNEAVDRLRRALRAIERRADVPLPEFMPVGSAMGVGFGDPDSIEAGDDDDNNDEELALVSLLARVVLLFARDYEHGAKLSLAVQLDCLRVLDREGVALRELPRLTGVSQEAVAMLVKRLETTRCCEQVPLARRRGKQVRLTADRGVLATRAGPRRVQRTLTDWGERYGADAVGQLRLALEPIVRDGTGAGSPLFEGLQPPPNGWRAKVGQPERLPWFPIVSHRGGYPDGS